MAEPWFHVESLPDEGAVVELEPEEARHATGSKRLQPGDAVVLFDGRGTTAAGALEAVGPRGRGTLVRIGEHAQGAAPPRRVHVACALPKGDRQATLLSMATQLGMSSFTPLVCARSVVKPSASFTSRARRIVVEACKQSRRAYVPDVRPAATPKEVGGVACGAVLVAHPGGEPMRVGLEDDAEVVVMIGPEGGFTDDEVASIPAARVVDLGAGTLRIETAAVAMVTLAGRS